MIITGEHAAAHRESAQKAKEGRCRCALCGARLIAVYQICDCCQPQLNLSPPGVRHRVMLVPDGVMTVDNERPE